MKIAKASPFSGKPVINMPSVYGACVGKEIRCKIPVIGKRPIRFAAVGLQEDMILQDGVITGVVHNDCEFEVCIIAENELGKDRVRVLFKIHEDTMLLTPLLGFTSWNAYGSEVNQSVLEETADRMLKNGIADYGYSYINIDSGWQKEYGGKYDAIMPNEKFPDMKGFCDRMHEKGFKCGIYSTPMLTAWGCPNEFESIPGCTRGEADILMTKVNGGIGIERMEANHVKQWEEWGFDYLKYDWRPTDPFNADKMKQELVKAGREMAFCVTVNADPVYSNYWKANCCHWRNNLDSRDHWPILKEYLKDVNVWEDVVCQGHFYDMDMLEIGDTQFNDGVCHLTEAEQIFAYSLRAFFLSPIQISCKLDRLTDFEYDLLCNEEVIRINQDALADYPKLKDKTTDGTVLVYERSLENGDKAIAVFNTSDMFAKQPIELAEGAKVRDLWTKTDIEFSKDFTYTVEAHSAVLLRVSE